MALKLEKLGAVDFGEFSATPKVNVERTLRIQQIKMTTEAEISAAKDTMAEAFGDDKEKVRAVLDELPLFELQILQAYLMGGERMANKMLDIINGITAEGVKND